MAKKFNDTETSILNGLNEALAYAEGHKVQAKTHKVKIPAVDVKKARKKLGLSQNKFAIAFGVSIATIRNWEQKRRKPQGAAKVLLNIININPDAVLNALNPKSHPA